MSRLSWNFLKTTNAQVLIFFSRAPDVANEQSCLKTTGLYDDLLSSLFHFFYFIFSAPISFSLCSPISLFLLDVPSQALSTVAEKLLFININM